MLARHEKLTLSMTHSCDNQNNSSKTHAAPSAYHFYTFSFPPPEPRFVRVSPARVSRPGAAPATLRIIHHKLPRSYPGQPNLVPRQSAHCGVCKLPAFGCENIIMSPTGICDLSLLSLLFTTSSYITFPRREILGKKKNFWDLIFIFIFVGDFLEI
jgi:hypothetical protein